MSKIKKPADKEALKKSIEVEAKNLMEMYKLVVEQGNLDFTQLTQHIYGGDDVDVRSKSHISVSDAFIKKLRMLSCFAHSLLAASHATEGAAVKFNRDLNPDYHYSHNREPVFHFRPYTPEEKRAWFLSKTPVEQRDWAGNEDPWFMTKSHRQKLQDQKDRADWLKSERERKLEMGHLHLGVVSKD